MAQEAAGGPQDAAGRPEEPSLGDLVAAATRDLSVLIRSEIALAKGEVGAELKKAAVGGGAFGAAAFVGIFAFGLLSFALAYGIAAMGTPVWAGFAIVGGAYLFVAALLGVVGLGSVKKIGPPVRTVRTLRETIVVLRTRRKVPAAADAEPRI